MNNRTVPRCPECEKPFEPLVKACEHVEKSIRLMDVHSPVDLARRLAHIEQRMDILEADAVTPVKSKRRKATS